MGGVGVVAVGLGSRVAVQVEGLAFIKDLPLINCESYVSR